MLNAQASFSVVDCRGASGVGSHAIQVAKQLGAVVAVEGELDARDTEQLG